jgi:O-antigen/teichoic acid export membrane protein
LITKLISLPLTIIVGVIVTRVLGPASKGSYVFVGLLGSFYLPWLSFGFGASIIYFVSSGRYAVRDVFVTCFLVGVTQGLLTALILGSLWRFDLLGVTASEIDTSLMIPALLLLPVQGAFLMMTRLLLGDSRFALNNAITLAMPILSSAMLLFFVVVFRWGLPGAVAGFVTANVLALIVLMVAVVPSYRPRLTFHPQFLGESMRYGVKAWGGDLAGRVNLRFDQAALSLFATDATLGVYSVAVTLSELLWFVPDSMSFVLFNRIVGTPSIDDRAELACRVHRVLLMGMIAAAIALAVSAHWLIRLAYTELFIDAVWPMLILLPGTVAMTTAKIVTKFLSGSGQPGRSSLLVAVGALVSVLIGLVLIPKFGMNGAALTSTIGYLATGAAAVYMSSLADLSRRPNLFGISGADLNWFFQQLRTLAPGRRA